MAEVQQSLAVDGYRLDVLSAAGTGLTVRIVALPGACADCLAPEDVLKMIISASVDGAYSVAEISLVL